MRISKEIIKGMVTQKTVKLVRLMTQEFGGEYTTWLATIQKSNLYSLLIDPKTHMWSEGDMYLRGWLIDELIDNVSSLEGIKADSLYGTAEQILYIQASILTELHTRCSLTQREVSEMIQETDLLNYIARSYGIHHVEGILSNLEDIQEYVKKFGIAFKIKRDS